jgi:predicted nucleotidyltransferase
VTTREAAQLCPVPRPRRPPPGAQPRRLRARSDVCHLADYRRRNQGHETPTSLRSKANRASFLFLDDAGGAQHRQERSFANGRSVVASRRRIAADMNSNAEAPRLVPSPPADPKLKEMVRRLGEHLRPARIYLFGSRARGDAGPDSDYDLLVVVATSTLPGYKRDQEAFRALRGVGVSKDVIVLTLDEFQRKSSVVCSLPATVLREGTLLYVA